MKNNRIYQFIQDMSYEDRVRLVIKIAKMRKLGKYMIHVKDRIYCNGILLMLRNPIPPDWDFSFGMAWPVRINDYCNISRLNLHYDANVMKLEDIGYMLQKNNRRAW